MIYNNKHYVEYSVFDTVCKAYEEKIQELKRQLEELHTKPCKECEKLCDRIMDGDITLGVVSKTCIKLEKENKQYQDACEAFIQEWEDLKNYVAEDFVNSLYDNKVIDKMRTALETGKEKR